MYRGCQVLLQKHNGALKYTFCDPDFKTGTHEMIVLKDLVLLCYI